MTVLSAVMCVYMTLYGVSRSGMNGVQWQGSSEGHHRHNALRCGQLVHPGMARLLMQSHSVFLARSEVSTKHHTRLLDCVALWVADSW